MARKGVRENNESNVWGEKKKKNAVMHLESRRCVLSVATINGRSRRNLYNAPPLANTRRIFAAPVLKPD